jgi:GNAT superfamily N-acetyltransferase
MWCIEQPKRFARMIEPKSGNPVAHRCEAPNESLATGVHERYNPRSISLASYKGRYALILAAVLTMINVEIEKAQTSDLAGITGLIGQDDMSPDSRLDSHEVEKLFKDFCANPWHELYVAKQQENIIGTFSLFIVQHLSHNGGRSLIVEDVVVKTEFQGKGIGRKMMEFAIERGQALGCYKIFLSSGAKRTDAHAFYEGLGFQKHGFTFYLPLESSN